MTNISNCVLIISGLIMGDKPNTDNDQEASESCVLPEPYKVLTVADLKVLILGSVTPQERYNGLKQNFGQLCELDHFIHEMRGRYIEELRITHESLDPGF